MATQQEPGTPGSTQPQGGLKHIAGAVIRFCGDSGDGMQLTGTQFTNAAAAGRQRHRDLPRLPRRDPRARRHAVPACRGFQMHFSAPDIYTPGDAPDVLVAMNPAALKTNLRDLQARRHR